MRRMLTSIAHGYQIIWVLVPGSVLHAVDLRAYGVPSRSGSLVPSDVAHRYSEDASVAAREVDML